MSLFGNPSTTGSLFGQPNTGNLFGQNNQQQQQQQQQQQPAQTSIFGQPVTQNAQQPQQQSSLFSGLGNQNNSQQGQQQNQQQTSSVFTGFTSNNPQQQQTGGLFNQNQQNQNQQQQLSQSLYQPAQQPDASITGQMQKIKEKWDPSHPDCAFRHWFYNKVDENKSPYFQPQAREDPKQWEEALAKKPGPGYIPVLCVGFSEMGERIKLQQKYLGLFNQRLHEINNSLEAMLSKHDLEISVRALDARRRHTVLKQRAIALATKVQILRNRGYALGGDEEVLKAKLQALERGVLDPGLSARAEEIWARMVGVRERAKILKEEMNKRADSNGPVLDEETLKRAEKILEDYAKQLGHLKRELALVSEELKEWEKDQPAQASGR